MAQQTMTLNQMMQAYQQLTADYQARRIDQASYSAALIGLRSQDAEGRWWTYGVDGGFLWYDGNRWLPGQPATVKPPGIPPHRTELQTTHIVAGVHDNAALKEKVNRKVVVADPTMGPIGFTLASIRGVLSGLKALIKNPKIVLLTLFISLVQTGLAYLKIYLPTNEIVKYASVITFAQGGMYAGLLGAVGGVIGKGFYAWFINTVVFSLFKKKEMKQAKQKEPKVKGWFALGLAGLGFALILYNFMSGNASIENSAIGVTALMASYRTLKKKNGFLVGFICSFTKGRMTQNSAGVVIKGMMLGFGFGVLSSLRFVGLWCYMAGAIILVLAFVMRLSKRQVAVTSVLLMFFMFFVGAIIPVYATSTQTFDKWVTPQEAYGIKGDTLSSYIELAHAVSASPPASMELTLIAIGARYFDESVTTNPQVVLVENGESGAFTVEAQFEDFSFNSLVRLHLEDDGYYASASTAYSANNSWTNNVSEEGTYQSDNKSYFSFRHLGTANYLYQPYLEPGKFYVEIDIAFGYGDILGEGKASSATQILARVDRVKRDMDVTESAPASGVWELKETLTYMLVAESDSVSSTELFTDQWYGNATVDKKNIGVTGNEITLVSTRDHIDYYEAHEVTVTYGQPPSLLKAFDAINLSVSEIGTYYLSETNETTTLPQGLACVGFLSGRRNDTFSTKLSAGDTMAYPFGANLGQTWFERSGDFLSSTIPPGKVGGEIMTLEMALGVHEPYDTTQSRIWEIPVIAYVYEWQGGVILPTEDEEDEEIVDEYWEEHASEEETGVISAAAALAGLVGAAAAAGAAAAGIAGGFGGSGNSGYIKKDEDGDYIVNDPVTGEERVYVKNQKTGRYTNPLSGAEYTEDELYNQVASRAENASVLRQDHEQSEQAKAEQREANQKLSQAQDEMRKENQMRNVQRDLEQKGKDGDELAAAMANKLHKMNKQKSETGAYNQKDVDQFKKTYGRWTQGTVAGNSGLPKAESEWELFKQGFANTGEEIARGESNKAIALRIAVSLLTGSFVARGVMSAAAVAIGEAGLELAQAGYVMKDYVDEGGNDWKEGAQQAITRTLVGEAIGRTFGLGLGALGKAAAKTGQVMSKVKAGKYIVDGITNFGEKAGKVLTANVGDVPKLLKSLSKEASKPAIASKMAKAGASKLKDSLDVKVGNKTTGSVDDLAKKVDQSSSGIKHNDINNKSVSKEFNQDGTKGQNQSSKASANNEGIKPEVKQPVLPKDTPEYKKVSQEVDDSLKQADARAAERIVKFKNNVSKDPDLAARKVAHDEGGKQGLESVDNLEKARQEYTNNPDSLESKKAFEKAVENVQKNKHAQKVMNEKDLVSNETRQVFNNAKIKKDAVISMNTSERIAVEFGLDPKSVSNVQATNSMNTSGVGDIKGVAGESILGKASKGNARKFGESDLDLANLEKKGGDKISIDLDQTYRVEIKKTDGSIEYRDISARKIKQIQNEEVYKEWNDGQLPMKDGEVDHKLVEKFAEDMDYTVLDARSPDAYGTVGDLQQALKSDGSIRKYGDAEGVSRSIQYKSDEWTVKAGHKSDAGDLIGAEGDIAEGIRQGTKQFDSQLVYQVKAINAKGGSTKLVIPDKLSEGMSVLKQIGHGKGKLSPAEAEAVLKEMGTNTDEILKMNSEQTEIINRLVARRLKDE